MYNRLNSSKQASPFLLILDDSFFQRINELIYLYQTLTSTQTLTPPLPWFKVTTELLEVALTRHVKQGVNVDINLGFLYHTLDFLKKVTTKLHRGTRASNSTAFPWRNIPVYIFIKVRIPCVHNSLVRVILPYLLIFTCFAKRGIPYKELLL